MVKIDLISGFLGAGKTTFANMLLRHYMDKGLKPIYIVNEFGKTGLDAEIIKSDGFEAIEIEGGCICCTLKDDISSTILNVIDVFSPTNIVFEPSGIFIFDNFFVMLKEPNIRQRCELGNIITIVDSINFSFSKATYGGFIYNQIKNAPAIVLSKLEKTTHSADDVICDIKNINPGTTVISKVWDSWNAEDFSHLLSQEKDSHISYQAHNHSSLRSITIKPQISFTQKELDQFLARYKAGIFGELYRVKGIITHEKQPMLINIAKDDITLEKFKGIAESTLTFIGQTINKDEIYSFLT